MKIQEYNLRITEKQSELIMSALDLYTRLSAGQLNELKKIGSHEPSEFTLTKLQKSMFPKLDGLNHSYGIHSKELPDKIREAYDIFKVMMHEFNKDEGIMNVYSSKVRQTSKKLLPLFEKQEVGK